MDDKELSTTQLARLLTDAGVPSNKRKVKKWREVVPGRTLAEDAARALDKTFGTVNVFTQFVYKPEKRGTHRALSDLSAEYVTRREYEELKSRLEQLEKGS